MLIHNSRWGYNTHGTLNGVSVERQSYTYIWITFKFVSYSLQDFLVSPGELVIYHTYLNDDVSCPGTATDYNEKRKASNFQLFQVACLQIT